MKKSINVIAMFVIAFAVCLTIVRSAIAQTILCRTTTTVINENAEIHEVTVEFCGECTWRTIAPGWMPGDPASGKWITHYTATYVPVQTCKFGSGSCTATLMIGVDCPLDDEDPEEGLVDTDGDGVYDFEDDCPTIPGLASNFGCP